MKGNVSKTTPESLDLGAIRAVADEAKAAAEMAETAAASVANKADKSDTLSGYGIADAYTKDEIDLLESNIIQSLDIQSDELRSEFEAKADKATTLSGYGITDAYTKDESDRLRGYVRLSVSDLKTVLEEVEAVLDEVIDYQENYPSDYILEAISPDGDDLIATPSQENFSIDTTE